HERMPEVFGTPIMIYHMDGVAADAIHPYLPDGWISVGVVVNVKHLAATPVGMKVTINAQVIAVNDNTITFKVEAFDEVDKIGEGTHVRAPVELNRFLKRMKSKIDGAMK
ncbi:MAG: thioesterase family protein, partial [Acidobacteriota bacterium]